MVDTERQGASRKKEEKDVVTELMRVGRAWGSAEERKDDECSRDSEPN